MTPLIVYFCTETTLSADGVSKCITIDNIWTCKMFGTFWALLPTDRHISSVMSLIVHFCMETSSADDLARAKTYIGGRKYYTKSDQWSIYSCQQWKICTR